MRGSKIADPMHLCDWFTTFAAMAGVDPTDHSAAKAGLPPIDGKTMQSMHDSAVLS
jgi:arylsulfatase I/J